MSTGTALLLTELILAGSTAALYSAIFIKPLYRLVRSPEERASAKAELRLAALDLLRAFVIYVSYLIISGTLSNLFLMGGIGIIKDQNLPIQPVYLVCALLLPMSFHSVHRASELYDKEARKGYPFNEKREYKLLPGLITLFRTPTLRRKLFASLSVVLTLLLILPWQVGYNTVVGAIHGGYAVDGAAARLTVLCVMAPAICIMMLLAKTSAHKWWNICRTQELERLVAQSRPNLRLLLEILKITLIYAITYPMLPAVIMMAVSTVLTFGIFTLWIWIAVIGSILALIVIRLFIAYRRRAKYVKRMLRTANENGYKLTPLRGMRLSLFFPHGKADFVLEKDGKRHDCKLIGSTKGSRPMYISPDGNYTEKRTVSILRINLFHIMTETSYAFEGESKLIIIAPMSRKTYINYGRTDTVPDDGDGGLLPTVVQMRAAAMGGGKARGRSLHGPGYVSDVDRGIIKRFETGERMGEYKLFSGNDFLSAMRNGYVER